MNLQASVVWCSAIVIVVLLLRDVFLRWLAFRRDQFEEVSELMMIRAEFEGLKKNFTALGVELGEEFGKHKIVHEKAIANLVQQMKDEANNIRTKVSANTAAVNSIRPNRR